MLHADQMHELAKRALGAEDDFSDVYSETLARRTIIFENGRLIDLTEGKESGLGIRVIRDFKTHYAYSNDLDFKNLLALSGIVSHDRIKNLSSPKKALHTLTPSSAVIFNSIPLVSSKAGQVKILEEAALFAKKMDPRIINTRARFTFTDQTVRIINSLGEYCDSRRVLSVFSMSVTLKNGNELHNSSEAIGGNVAMDYFTPEKIRAAVLLTARRAINQANAQPAPVGEACVVLASSAGGTLIHEAVGHGLEADLACDGQSVFSDMTGKRVAKDFVTITDGATLPGALGSYDFDDEGTPAQKTTLIEKGVVKNFLYDRLSAMRYGGNSTGNGRRESYEYRPVVRMTNTVLEPGTASPKDPLAGVGKGVFVSKMGGGQVNTVNGDFVFEAPETYLIENGEITRPVRGASLIGNALDILEKIDCVANDLGFSIGYCGKDGQSVPVSDGLPTIRIASMTIGGTGENL